MIGLNRGDLEKFESFEDRDSSCLTRSIALVSNCGWNGILNMFFEAANKARDEIIL